MNDFADFRISSWLDEDRLVIAAKTTIAKCKSAALSLAIVASAATAFPLSNADAAQVQSIEFQTLRGEKGDPSSVSGAISVIKGEVDTLIANIERRKLKLISGGNAGTTDLLARAAASVEANRTQDHQVWARKLLEDSGSVD